MSFGIVILSQLGFLEFVSFSADNPATYKVNEKSTVMPSKSLLDSMKSAEIELPKDSQLAPAPKDEISSLAENKQSTTLGSKIDASDETNKFE